MQADREIEKGKEIGKINTRNGGKWLRKERKENINREKDINKKKDNTLSRKSVCTSYHIFFTIITKPQKVQEVISTKVNGQEFQTRPTVKQIVFMACFYPKKVNLLLSLLCHVDNPC